MTRSGGARRRGEGRAPGRLAGRPALVLLAGLAASVVAGCSGGPSPSPSASSSPSPTQRGVAAACALVTDVVGAVGREPIASPNGYSADGSDRCMWILGRDPSRYLGLTIGPSANHAATIDAFGAGQAVPDLGDDARWWEANRTLSVVFGDGSFQIDLHLDPTEATRARAEAIARQIVSALGA
jgi:hypothetical protein